MFGGIAVLALLAFVPDLSNEIIDCRHLTVDCFHSIMNCSADQLPMLLGQIGLAL
jgi:hypothetical protein